MKRNGVYFTSSIHTTRTFGVIYRGYKEDK